MIWIATLVLFTKGLSEPNLIKNSRLLTKVGDWNESQVTVGRYRWWTTDQIIADGKKEPLIIDFKLGCTIPSPEYHLIFSEDLVQSTHYVSKNIWSGIDLLAWIIFDATGKNQIASWTSKTLAPRQTPGAENGFPIPDIQFSKDEKSLFQIDYWQADEKVNAQIMERRFPDVQTATTHPVSEISYDSSIEVIGRRVMLAPYWQFVKKDYWIKEWDLTKTSKEAHKWLVPFPDGKTFRMRLTSPDQKHSLWIFERAPNDSISAESMWVSDVHGENMKEIGEIVFPRSDLPDGQNGIERASSQDFGGIQWNPDSKRVSYIFMRKLYIVQVVP